jgi:conjugal transfer pilus assembly protein TraL
MSNQIPTRIDDPMQALFWTVDEFIPFSIIAGIGFATGNLTICILLAMIAVKLYRKYREGRPQNFILHWLYWYGIIPFKSQTFRNPFIRKYFS